MWSEAEKARDDDYFSKALIAYLQAQELYPASYFVEEGINECVQEFFESRSLVEPAVPTEE